MPQHELHEIIDLMVLGKKYEAVHDFMDQFSMALKANHRNFYHDMTTVQALLYWTRDPRAAESAYLHIWLDIISDKVGKAESVPTLLRMIQTGMIKL